MSGLKSGERAYFSRIACRDPQKIVRGTGKDLQKQIPPILFPPNAFYGIR
ncbi:MAG: hypothetical protein HDT47_03710 [Ruminococcaceae bacterium]|nr:hypothetical protein [Oscillospiraceae bacterium]